MQRGKKSLNDFKFGTSVGRFLSDGTASTAVKGLLSCQSHRVHFSTLEALESIRKAFGDREQGLLIEAVGQTLVYESGSTSPGY